MSLFAEERNPLLGTWEGAIGKYKIVVCFQTEYLRVDGNYYYKKYLEPIHLEEISKDKFLEPDSSEWIIESIDDSLVKGRWIDSNKKRTYPIFLKFVNNCGDEEEIKVACGCDEFNNPIEKLPPLIIDTIKISENHFYRTFKREGMGLSYSSFELLWNNEAAKKINKRLKNDYYDVPAMNAKEFNNCNRDHITAYGIIGGEEFYSVEPYLWTDRYLGIVCHNSGFCASAHPFSGSEYEVVDLQNGEIVSFNDYFNDNNIEEEIQKKIFEPIPDSLNEYFGEVLDSTDDCWEILKDNHLYNVRLDSSGFVFYTEFGHCCKACNVDIYFSFQEILPFLTDEGKKFVEQLFK